MYSRVCFFFFQAEDGIRDSSVTGVQTCALPISVVRRSNSRFRFAADEATARRIQLAQFRSEERRGGKGGRSRGAPYHLKKNGEKEMRQGIKQEEGVGSGEVVSLQLA